MGTFPSAPSASTGLLHAHVPFDEPANLALGVAALHHACDEFAVLLLRLAVLLGPERDDRKQVLDLGEYPLFDHLANLLVGGPGRILAATLRPRAQRELHDLVAEVLGIGDPGR